ncbi:hypothetical protein PROVRUST_06490 [Providencia rustigianii DSM 4541]|uniref:Uncharacterized protein n=1 Tax=Providencia rustigianii DSM 4541 TaxID=500637 RepID=D1P2R3_9GAMM|nr:hypothetical protein PROVRUST_06490 [Providencia rustigianii DSM 4541]
MNKAGAILNKIPTKTYQIGIFITLPLGNSEYNIRPLEDWIIYAKQFINRTFIMCN